MPQYRFGDFTVDTDTVEVIGPDGVRDLEPQVFSVLQYLVEQGDRLVTKDELLENVWGNKFVSESALTTRIKQARRAVDDDGNRQWAIKTVHGRGYRFVPEVERVEPGTPAVEADEPTFRVAPVQVPPGPVRALPDELRMESRRPFCGRVEERRQGVDVLLGANGDEPIGWVWILGEPGIGKSRLAAELASDAYAAGHEVVFGRNSEDLRVPYQPFVEMLGQLTADGEALPEQLAPLLPAPTVRSLPREQRSDVDDEGLRFELFEAVARWLAERAGERPLTLVVDDVHWAADSTLQLLRHLQQRPGAAAVTFLLTARDTAPDSSDVVDDLMATAQGRPRTTLLHLGGLDEAAAAELLGTDGVDLAAVMAQTAGNPLFLQAVDPVVGAVHIEGAVRRRLATLPAEVQDTLRMMSVLGLEFRLEVAAAAHDLDELELLDQLEAAGSARLLEEIGPERFRFTHALVRSSLRDQLSAARRSRMHRRIMVALERVFGEDGAHLPELAYHTAEAAQAAPDLRPTAVARLHRAAQAAVDRLSFEEASALLAQARALAGDLPAEERARLALAHAAAELRAGRSVPASRHAEDAIAAARETEDVPLRVEAAIRYEDARWRPGLSGDRSLRYLDEAVELLDRAGRTALGPEHQELSARLGVARLRALAMAGRRHEASAAYADAMAAASGSPTMEANALSVYLGHLVLMGVVEEARPLIARLVDLEPEVRDGDVALHALHDRIMFATLTGDAAEARRLVEVMAEQQRRWRSPFWEFVRTNQEVMEAFYVGDLAESERLTEHCLTLANRLPDEDGTGLYGLRMFLIRREQDRLGAVAPMLRTVVARAGGDALWTPGLAWLLAETGAEDEATAALAELRASEFQVPHDAMWGTVMAMLTETVVRLDDREACATLLGRMGGLAGINVVTGSGQLCFGRGDRYLGMLSYSLGDLATAEEQLGSALEGDAAGGSVLWANESRLWLSRVRRAQGHRTEADAMVRVVAHEAAAAGLARLARLAAAEPTD